MAVVVSACAAGSDDVVDTVPSEVAPNATVEVPVATEAEVLVEVDSVEDDPVAVEEDDPVVTETLPSLPPNIWPEEIVEASADDAKNVAEDVVTRSAVAGAVGVLPDGVGSVTAVVTSADGDVCEVCLWLADDDLSRQRGLMGVTDLGDAVGMAFVWEQPRTGNFFMFQTPTPLSIAWFDDGGAHVGEADMEPCLVDNSATCERYTADSPYVLAVEMFGGQLDAIGIGPGASIELIDLPCT